MFEEIFNKNSIQFFFLIIDNNYVIMMMKILLIFFHVRSAFSKFFEKVD